MLDLHAVDVDVMQWSNNLQMPVFDATQQEFITLQLYAVFLLVVAGAGSANAVKQFR